MNAFDLVVLLTVANTAQDAIIGNDNSVTKGLTGATTLLVVNYLTIRVLYDYSKEHRRIGASGEILKQECKIVRRAMKRELITMDELKDAASRHGRGSLRKVLRATLNTDGSLEFVKKREVGENEYQKILKRIGRLSDLVGRHGSEGSPGN